MIYMNKYNIEGDIDFFEELYKSLNENEDIDEKLEDNNYNCLITNQPLVDKYVSLDCGHKFNYIPIYNDIFNHKKKFNCMESSSKKLNTNEIRCPYCRRKQSGVLPYYEELGLKKINGVNFYDPCIKQNMYHKCEYLYPNENYDPTKPESIENSPYLSEKCYFLGFPIELYNSQNPSQPINYGDTKHYCYTHKKIMIKHYKKLEKEKEKLAKKQAKELQKQKAKEEKQKAKDKAKEEKQKAKDKAKEEKQKAKELAKKPKSPSENVILSSETKIGCMQILKTGINKGKPCGCKIFSMNTCKRHVPKNQNQNQNQNQN
jgi:hypothetical protein